MGQIADFGISKRAIEGLTALRTTIGTPDFTAPEVLPYLRSSGTSDQVYTRAVDIWSLGVMALVMLGSENPFRDLAWLG